MRGREKQEFLNNMTFELDEVQYKNCLNRFTEKELLKELNRLRRLIKKNTLFIRRIKEMLERQITIIEDTILFKDVEVVYVGSEITIGRL
jgi:ribosomal protein S3AE